MKLTKAGKLMVLAFLLLAGCSTEEGVHSPVKNELQVTEMGGAS